MNTTRHIESINGQPHVKRISIELRPDEVKELIDALKNTHNSILIKNIVFDLTGQLSYC